MICVLILFGVICYCVLRVPICGMCCGWCSLSCVGRCFCSSGVRSCVRSACGWYVCLAFGLSDLCSDFGWCSVFVCFLCVLIVFGFVCGVVCSGFRSFSDVCSDCVLCYVLLLLSDC